MRKELCPVLLIISPASAVAAEGSVQAAPEVFPALKNAPPNTWVKLDDGARAARSSGGLVFVPEEGRFVCLGGSRWGGNKETAYTELTLDLAKGQWENRF